MRFSARATWFVVGNALYLAAVAAILLAMSLYSIGLFHATVEVFSMVVAAAVLIIAWNARRLLDNDYLLLIGLSYMSFAILDLPHMLAFPEIGGLPGYGIDLASQIYVAQRFILATSFLLAPAFLTRRLPAWPALAGYVAVTAAALYVVFTGNFPTAFTTAEEMTPFKLGSQFLIAGMFGLSIAALWVHREKFDRAVLLLLTSSVVFFILSELLFGPTGADEGILVLVGHFSQGMAFYLTYKAVVVTALVRPTSLLFKDLADREHQATASEERYRLVADTLQTALLQVPEQLESVSLIHRYESSSDIARIGGDFYDVFEISETYVGFMLGDVAGKGLEAATTTAQVKSTVRAYAYLCPDPSCILEHTNDVLCRELGETQLVTAFVAILDRSNGRLHIGSAGHEQPIFCKRERCVLLAPPTNIPLGVECGYRFERESIDLRPGEAVIVYTDGVPDARRDGETFGRDRVRALAESADPTNPGRVAEMLVEETLRFSRGRLVDDVAVLGVQFCPLQGAWEWTSADEESCVPRVLAKPTQSVS